MHVVSVRPGEEVMEILERRVKELDIFNAAIVSIVGAVDKCCISNMPASDPKSDTLTEYSRPFEMSGTGEVAEGKPHIHCVLSTEGDKALAGHLHWARVETWFVNVYLLEA